MTAIYAAPLENPTRAGHLLGQSEGSIRIESGLSGMTYLYGCRTRLSLSCDRREPLVENIREKKLIAITTPVPCM